ncbi:MAG TPA: threonine synthase [Balneolales bacterium]|nr:threonine synthase [Balneolales bacterium]
MKYISTNKESAAVTFNEAILNGLANDGGLYVPESIPKLSQKFWSQIAQSSFQDIAESILTPYVSDQWNKEILHSVTTKAFNFKAPLVALDDHTYIMELFHGPTLAFKDFGARFLASSFEKIAANKRINILVATSGDTGSAVAQGFKDAKHVSVHLLYPSGKVSQLQEQQLTTAGGNVNALEINGTFDDCQRLVKEAFNDSELRESMILSSANSINIARLLPQSLYYVYALAQFKQQHSDNPVISVPSGNMGNVTGGLIAQKMGMPVDQFIIATNINDVVPEYLRKGIFQPRKSQRTIANAMDVGDPSNLARIQHLFNHSIDEMRALLKGFAFTDDETKNAIKKVYNKTGYILDPHTAIGYLASQEYRRVNNKPDQSVMVMATAHPAKFKDIVEPIINDEIPLPPALQRCMEKEKQSILMEPSYPQFKSYLMQQILEKEITDN